MKSFGQWFAEQSMPASTPATPEIHPDLWEFADGRYKVKCCACDQYYEIYCGPEEFTDDGNYCGRGPSCCP